MDTIRVADHPDIKAAFELRRGDLNTLYLVVVEHHGDTDQSDADTAKRCNNLAHILTHENVAALVLQVKDTTIRVIDLKRESAS
jgi:hypothetical protein